MNLFTRNIPYYHLQKIFTIPPETLCMSYAEMLDS